MKFENSLRERMLQAARELQPEIDAVSREIDTHADRVRSSTFVCARSVATKLGEFWKRSGDNGPVDVIDMFSGCGGMSAGFIAANGLRPTFKLVAATDIDPVANQTFEANLGLRPHCESVADLAKNERRLQALVREGGRRDGHPLVLIGCAPCQGFSSHRNSKGMEDPRNSLMVDFAKIARSLSPDVVIMENVPELLTERYWPILSEARKTLETSGYQVHVSIHNMATFGLPQERFRALIVAMRRSFRPPEGFLSRERFRTVRGAIAHLPAVTAGERSASDPLHYSAGHSASTIRTIQAVPKDGGRRPADVGPQCLLRIAQKQGRAAYEDVYGRLYWDRPAITITAYARNPASGRFVHPEQDRGLTIREAALLQGFPDDYWFAGTLDERFRQIGNAVPPPFSAHLAVHLLGEMLVRCGTPEPTTPSAGITSPVGASFSRLIPALKAGTRECFA
jgi:DNA (cytosine-5)-methyltransferase 1